MSQIRNAPALPLLRSTRGGEKEEFPASYLSAAKATLAVLAGGEGSRMGQAKGLLTVAGRPILEYLLDTIRWPGPTMVVTSPNRRSPPGAGAFGAEVVDSVSGLGPLNGILTALQHSRTETIVVTPVDMPGVGYEPLRWLAEQIHQAKGFAGVMLRQGDEIQPLPAAFGKSALAIIEDQITSGVYSLRALAEISSVAVLAAPASWPAEIWCNLNFPGDVVRFEQSIRGRLLPDGEKRSRR